jgi:hypothetical protein|tara:strand:- start:135 stop:464 length:330 start_codon:yes stop_codon:yes gene_type:complete
MQDNVPKNNNHPEIIKQVENWDMYARLVPTLFLFGFGTLILLGYIEFQMVFYVGLGLFAVTAICWWFWTIYTIKLLVGTLNIASDGLADVRDEFRKINEDIREFKDDIE